MIRAALASTDAVLTQLARWEVDFASEHATIYALVDGHCAREADDPIALPNIADAFRIDPILVPRADLKHRPDICPYLIPLIDGQMLLRWQEPAVSQFADNLIGPLSVHGSYVAAFLASSQRPESIADSLAQRFIQRNASGQRGVVPLFEPIRLALYINDDADRACTWLAGNRAWLSVDGARSLQTWVKPEDNVLAKRLQFTEMDAREQAKVPEIRRALVAARKASIDLMPGAERHAFQALCNADKAGLGNADDRLMYTLNTLALGPDWSDHQAAQRCIGIAVAGEQSLAAAMRDLPIVQQEEIQANRLTVPVVDATGAFA